MSECIGIIMGRQSGQFFQKINGIYLPVNHAVSYIGGVFLYSGYLAKKLFYFDFSGHSLIVYCAGVIIQHITLLRAAVGLFIYAMI